jgi:hypothetical protein
MLVHDAGCERQAVAGVGVDGAVARQDVARGASRDVFTASPAIPTPGTAQGARPATYPALPETKLPSDRLRLARQRAVAVLVLLP